MNYYPFHIGDYTSHTAHLDELEDLAYRRMIDAYYLQEAPLPREVAEIARLIRMRTRTDVITTVLREFFIETDAGWSHPRCDAEIQKMKDKQAKARASAAASVNVRRTNAQRTLNERSANAERTLNERSTDVELPTPTPTPIANNQKIKESAPDEPALSVEAPTDESEKPGEGLPAESASAPPKAEAANCDNALTAKPAKPKAETAADMMAELNRRGVDLETAKAYTDLRKAKRAAMSTVAINLLEREAVKAGMNLTQAVETCVMRGWAGFKAEWASVQTNAGRPAAGTKLERNRQVFDEWTGTDDTGGQIIDSTANWVNE